MIFPKIKIKQKEVQKHKPRESVRRTLANMFNSTEDPEPVPLRASSRIEFYNTFRNINRINEKVHMHKQAISPTIALLNHYEKAKLKPIPLGLLNNTDNVRLNQYYLGDRYAEALSSSIKEMKDLTSLELKGNKLSNRSSESILNSISSQSLKTLNLSSNRIGTKAVKRIVELFNRRDSNLKEINLDSACLRTRDIELLCEGLTKNKNVKSLSLAKNNISYSAVKSLGKMLLVNKTIRNLDLQWNYIYKDTASFLFQCLKNNRTVLQIDLSWNCIGNNADIMIESFAAFLRENRSVKHLDISYNSISFETCSEIAEALKENHTIVGIHSVGNFCKIDPQGFMIPITTTSSKTISHKRIAQGDSKVGENCWICEKWVETAITVSDSLETELNLHLEIDDYEPVPMKLINGVFTMFRVLPPTKAKFFFTDCQGQFISDYPVKAAEDQIQLNNLVIEEVHSILPAGDECSLKSRLEALPRPAEEKKITEFFIEPRWEFGKSLFKDYICDTSELLDRCFEHDWRHSRIRNLVHIEENACKKILRREYPLIRMTYKTLSMLNFSEIPSVSSNVLLDFLNQARVFSNFYGISDFGVNWNAGLIPKVKKQLYNPGNALVRYEFLELLVRIAHDKYLRSGRTCKISEGIEKLLEEIRPVMANFDYNSWRNSYFIEEIDIFFKNNDKLLKRVFERYSGRKTLPGQKKFMCIEEFREFCTEIGVLSDKSMIRNIDKIFAFSMMTQEDELFKKRHLEMSLIEFYEAIARVFDTIYSSGSLVEKLQEGVGLVSDLPEYSIILKKATFDSEN